MSVAAADALRLPSDALLLPPGTRLVHIGPPKTGTTSLQAALWAARDEIMRQGVRYAGRQRHSARAVLAVTGRPSPGDPRVIPPIRLWNELVREIRGAREPRVVLSSESFAYARPSSIPRIVADLDPARVHIAVTLRPLGRILASAWQERVQSGLDLPFDAWLEVTFNDPDSAASRSFWHHQRHDKLIARWGEVVGPNRVTVIVVDDSEHGLVLRVFERLLGLREGTLVADRDLANRSLTLPEVEAIQALLPAFGAQGLDKAAFHRIVRMRVAAHMKTRVPGPDEPRIRTPRWALDRAGEVEREMVAAIAASGVRVVGDLERLTEVAAGDRADDPQPVAPIPPEVAASMAMGVLLASGLVRDGKDARAVGPGPWVEPIELARVSTPQLGGVLLRRLRGAIASRIRRVLSGRRRA